MKPKNCLIIGACSGIGRAFALHLAQLGFQVFATALNDDSASELRASISNIRVFVLDLRNLEAIDLFCTQMRNEVPNLDALVCNAGVPLGGPISHLDIERLREIFQINVFGHIELLQKLAPLLRNSQDPRFIWTGSAAGYFVRPLLGGYAASKFAVTAIMDALRVEWMGRIQVLHIMPGGIRTDIWTKGARAAQQLEKRSGLEDYANAIQKLKDEAHHNSQHAAPVEKVVKAMHHALCSSHPRAVYRVGVDAKLAFWLKWLLPQRILDWLLRKIFW